MLVYQSYRTRNVPSWIHSCMNSVKKWAITSGYDYRFIDDELFSYSPVWYRAKVDHNVQLVSDLARLVLARKFLNEGYERVVWIDADLLIFDPQSFSLPTELPFAFCRETWLDENEDKNIIHQDKVNNSVSLFQQGTSFLDFYIDVCLKIVEDRQALKPVSVGTEFLTGLNQLYPLPLMHQVGIISPALVYGLVRRELLFVDEYLKRHGSPVYAVNLCGSKRNENFRNLKMNDSLMDQVSSYLLKNRGLKEHQSGFAV